MLLQEVIARKEYLDLKLVDIECYIDKLEALNVQGKCDLYNKAISEKFALLSKLRSHDILIDKLYKSNYITIGDSEISLYEARALLDTLTEKIGTFDSVIDKGDLECLDFFSLLQQRDSLYEEYIVLYNSVKLSEATINWSSEEVKE